MVQYLCFKFSHFSAWQLKTTLQFTSLSDENVRRPPKFERPPKFLLLCNQVRSIIIAYYVYYGYYKIDRNKQSKITVYETDTLNSHFIIFMEYYYQQSRLTAVEQITFHDTKMKHFTQTSILYSFPPSFQSLPYHFYFVPLRGCLHEPG
jgi:hypothetical protein